MDPALDTVPCPACGGAGGGPFGRAGSAWDDEAYVCVRCKGQGMVELSAAPTVARPGIVKASTVAGATAAPKKKRKASA